MSLTSIWGLPEEVNGIGNIYPVKMIDYDRFNSVSNYLRYAKGHFQLPKGDSSKIPLLDLLLHFFREDEIDKKLCILFSIILRSEVSFMTNGEDYYFQSEEVEEDGKIIYHCINRDNYDEFRQVVMKQNLIHEPKVYKNKMVQQWAEKVLNARNKNSANIEVEDMITTVSAFTGKNYNVLMNSSIYQLYADFYRVRKMKNFDTSVLAGAVGGEMKLEDFAESLDIYKNPYDDLFVGKGKMKNINNALKG